MPPPRTLHVDRKTILATIRRLMLLQRQETAQRTVYYRQKERDELMAMAEWVPRDLPLLAGRLLTPSERKRHQEALRDMEREGLVKLDTRHVALTPEGEAAADA